MITIQNTLAVHFHAGYIFRLRACSYDHILRSERATVDGDLRGRHELPIALDDLHLVLQNRRAEAFVKRFDDLLLTGHDGGVVQRDVVHANAQRGGPAHALEKSGAFEPCLSRDAAAVEAGPAYLVAFDEGRCQA